MVFMNTNIPKRLIRGGYLLFCAATIVAASHGMTSSEEALPAKLVLDLDSAHVIAARQAGFGFTIREVSFPARCSSNERAGLNLIVSTVLSDRSVGWADTSCEFHIFEGKTLQNGWMVESAKVRPQCEFKDGESWRSLPEKFCTVNALLPKKGETSLSVRVLASLNGSGAVTRQERRLLLSYTLQIVGPRDKSPWSIHR
jgi:hypothetical protein